jgi:hypothetical protein
MPPPKLTHRRAPEPLKGHPNMTLLRPLLTVLCAAVLVACSPSTGPSKGKPNPGHAQLPDMALGVGGNGGSGGSGGGGGSGGSGGSGGTKQCMIDCATLGASCGKQGDGCGGVLDCGSCNAPDTCGGAGKPNVCGHGTTGGPGGPCVPKSCVTLGFNCGPAGDGCGNMLNCGSSCPNPGDICGGGGKPGVCGGAPTGGTCTGAICPAVCPANSPTKISGYVYAPTDPLKFGAADPLPNALVFIPTKALDPLPQGSTSCTPCNANASGAPLVSTTTDALGHFELDVTPAGPAKTIPLVVELGKWRREVNISQAITPCVMNTLTNPDDTRLPRKQGDGIVSDIPKIALVTGAFDQIECTLMKMGIDTSEFTNPTGSGRVNVYKNNGNFIDTNTPVNDPAAGSTPLTGSQSALDVYDMVILDCIGSPENVNGQDQTLADYVNLYGGRVFASHYGYSWLMSTFTTVATWAGGGNDWGDGITATIDSANTAGTPGNALATWLNAVDKAAFPFGQIVVDQVKQSVSAVVSSLVRQFMTYDNNGTATPLQFTFDTPVGNTADKQCGRVVFADFHVDNKADVSNSTQLFPKPPNKPFCPTSGALTAQEKVLEYMLFDLSSCIQNPPPPPPPMCVALDCAKQNIGCGPAGDGCGLPLDCGKCKNPGDTCGGGGTPYQCGQTVSCVPLTCKQLGYNCGPAGDGCGNLLDCGTCVSPQTCGGNGTPGVCGGII